MKKLFVPLIVGLVTVGSSFAWATEVSGSITSIDPTAHQIVLDNGTTYSVKPDVKLSSLAVGDKVTVNTETQGDQQIVNKVTKASG